MRGAIDLTAGTQHLSLIGSLDVAGVADVYRRSRLSLDVLLTL